MGVVFFFQAEDGIRDADVTGVQTCALPIWATRSPRAAWRGEHVSAVTAYVVADELAVRHEGVDGLLVQRDRALARLRLGALHPDVTRVAWVAERANDPQPPRTGDGPVIERPLQLQVIPAQGGQLPPAQPGQRCYQHQGPVAGTDRCGDPVQLGSGEPHLTARLPLLLHRLGAASLALAPHRGAGKVVDSSER